MPAHESGMTTVTAAKGQAQRATHTTVYALADSISTVYSMTDGCTRSLPLRTR